MGTPHQSASRFPGFDGLRLLAAVSVIFSHAFLLATGSEATEPLVRLLGPGNIFGLYGVFTFFIISGFLLARSLSANPQPITYAVNRTLRILPGFLFCIALTAFVLGPAFSQMPLRDYSSRADVGTFLRMSISTLGDWPLPGVFAYKGAYATVANGSLWSLHYEALSYILLLVFWMSLRSHTLVAAAGSLLTLLVWCSPVVAKRIPSVAYTLPYFSAGVAMSWFQAKYGTRRLGAVISALGLIIAAAYGLQAYAFAIFGAYLVVYFAERKNAGSKIALAIGDCSYGLYLFGWPAEQVVKQLTGTESALALFLLATPLAFLLALLSYHAVEKPTINARAPVAALISRGLSKVFGARPGYASAGAKLGFIVMATFILTAKSRWWYFFESLGLIILAASVGGGIARLCSGFVFPGRASMSRTRT
ncbi:MAG: acyltransferase [Vicinamibacterales bacterium]